MKSVPSIYRLPMTHQSIAIRQVESSSSVRTSKQSFIYLTVFIYYTPLWYNGIAFKGYVQQVTFKSSIEFSLSVFEGIKLFEGHTPKFRSGDRIVKEWVRYRGWTDLIEGIFSTVPLPPNWHHFLSCPPRMTNSDDVSCTCYDEQTGGSAAYLGMCLSWTPLFMTLISKEIDLYIDIITHFVGTFYVIKM